MLLLTVIDSTTTTASSAPDNDGLASILKVLIPVFLFFAGLLTNRLLEKRKENKRLADVRLYYLSLLTYLYQSIEIQRGCIMHAAIISKKFMSTKISIEKVPMFTTEHIKRVNQADLYKIFVTYGKGSAIENVENFLSIQVLLDSIDIIKPSIDEQSKLMVSGYVGAVNSLNEALKYVRLEYNKRIVNIAEKKGNVINDNILSFMRPFMPLFGQMDNLGVDKINEIFIEPLSNFFMSLPPSLDYDSFFSAVNELDASYDNLIRMRKGYIINLTDKARLLNDASVQLKNLMKYLGLNSHDFEGAKLAGNRVYTIKRTMN